MRWKAFHCLQHPGGLEEDSNVENLVVAEVCFAVMMMNHTRCVRTEASRDKGENSDLTADSNLPHRHQHRSIESIRSSTASSWQVVSVGACAIG